MSKARRQRNILKHSTIELKDLVSAFYTKCINKSPKDINSIFMVYNMSWQRYVRNVNDSMKEAWLYVDAFENCVKEQEEFIKSHKTASVKVKTEMVRILNVCTEPKTLVNRIRNFFYDKFGKRERLQDLLKAEAK